MIPKARVNTSCCPLEEEMKKVVTRLLEKMKNSCSLQSLPVSGSPSRGNKASLVKVRLDHGDRSPDSAILDGHLIAEIKIHGELQRGVL